MTTWKEYPYLFCNGKFKVVIENDGDSWKELWFTRHELRGGGNVHIGSFSRQLPLSECTLIARKIEDMTDEETALFGRYGYADERQPGVWQDIRNLISEHASKDFFSPTEFLQLIDLGVYPFDQNHFETGDVIDIKTLENL